MTRSRLLTKSDFDGVLCGALLKKAGITEEIVFVNSFDFSEGAVPIGKDDIACNLPYSEASGLCFDYGKPALADNHITSLESVSSAEQICERYKDKLKDLNEERLNRLLASVAKSNTGNFTKEEVLHPQGYDALGFLLDSRTGIGRVRAFRISNYALMVKLVDLLLVTDIDELLATEDLKERVDYYRESTKDYLEMLEANAVPDGPVLILDLRKEPYLKPANRFVKFAKFPEVAYSIQIMWGLRKKNTVLAVGKSIFRRNENKEVDLEIILKKYGGISRKNSGTLQVSAEETEELLSRLVKELKEY